MRQSRLLLLINALIIIFLLVGAVSVGLIGLTAVGVGSGLKVGKLTSTTSGTITTISVPVAIHNGGSLGLNDLRLSALVTDSAGDQLLTGTAGPVSVGAGQNKSVTVSLVLDSSTLSSSTLQSLATDEQHLNVAVTASTSVPPFLTLSADVTAALEWGAPVSDLTVGTPTVSSASGSSLQVNVPVSFKNNNSYYTVSGQAQINVLDSTGVKVGTGSLDVNVPPNTDFSQTVALTVTIPQSELQSLIFNSSTLQYTAQVDVTSGGQSVLTLNEPLTYQWGAPISNLAVGQPSVQQHNGTSVAVSIPVSFSNENSAFDLGASMAVKVENSSTGAALGTGSLTVDVPHGTSFNQVVSVNVQMPSKYFDHILYDDATLGYAVHFSGTFQGVDVSFVKSVDIIWGAPLKGLAFQSASVAFHNSTDSQISVPYSFKDNSAWLGVDGTVSGVIRDSSGTVVGNVPEFTLSASPGQTVSDVLTGYVHNSAAGDSSFTVTLTITTSVFTATLEETLSA
jgi:hypothetical protein